MKNSSPEKDYPKFLNEFWPFYRKRAVLLAVSTEVVLLALTVTIILVLYPNPPIGAWVVIIVVAAMAVTIMTIMINVALRPLRDLSNALVHVSGERSASTPPRLNDAYNTRTKLRPLIELIYNLATQTPQANEKTADTPGGVLESNVSVSGELNHTTSGIIMLNAGREIVFANKSAPIHIDGKGIKTLSLIFDKDNSIYDWLNERGDHDVRADHVWKRISNKLTGEADRRIFDMFVSYERGSSVETIITLVDRTGEYLPEDDDLDFIAFAAHELRGPITVIRGYLDTLNDEMAAVSNDEHKELFQRLIVSANRLSGYVNNILNASRYDRRHLKIHLREISIASIYDSISDDMQMRATAQGRLLGVSFPEGLPTVAADANSISEVMGNLVDNAIKYSNEGGSISVSADVSGDFVEVSVVDQGIGMPANVIGNLFQKFYRSHRSRETVAGTGIGLYISKAIVESNGGKIGVKSVEGHGSTFSFTLPIYATVKDKLAAQGTNNESFIEQSSVGWIKNHGAFRG